MAIRSDGAIEKAQFCVEADAPKPTSISFVTFVNFVRERRAVVVGRSGEASIHRRVYALLRACRTAIFARLRRRGDGPVKLQGAARVRASAFAGVPGCGGTGVARGNWGFAGEQFQVKRRCSAASERAPMDRPGFTYIMASAQRTAYVGSTNNLVQRAWQHRNGMADGFTKRHGCWLLVWFEAHDSIDEARLRELRVKKWKRLWKLSEIERVNPEWQDLYETLL